jgi:hypothetical protein
LWEGCCEHVVTAVNGTAAKRLAIDQHKQWECTQNSGGLVFTNRRESPR